MSRVACLCPGCRRTIAVERTAAYRRDPIAGQNIEWICGRHWPAVPRHFRRRLFAIRRRAKKDSRWRHLEAIAWQRCRRAAIEEALMGFTP